MYSIDVRKMVTLIYSTIQSLRKTSKLCKVSHTTVRRWLIRFEKKQYKRNGKFKSDEIITIIKETIKRDPYISLRKLQKLIQETLKISVSKELIRIALKKQGLTKKKVYFYGETKDLADKTSAFIQQRDKYVNENKTFLAIDAKLLLEEISNMYMAIRKKDKDCLFVKNTLL